MTDFLQKFNIPVAVPNSKKFRLQSNLLGTADFFQLIPVFMRELIGSRGASNQPTSIKLQDNYFMKLQPLFRPVFGSAQCHIRAFFVPYRTIWDPFNTFLADSPETKHDGTTQIIQHVPVIENSELVFLFTDMSYSPLLFTTTSSPTNADYVTNSMNFKLSTVGRALFKLLEALGYKIIFGDKSGFTYSALPLLSMAKVVLDYYYPNQYAHYGPYVETEKWFKYHDTFSLTAEDVRKILATCFLSFYENDLFNSAFDLPASPALGVGSTNWDIDDITNPTSIRTHVYNGTILDAHNNPVGTPTAQGVNAGTLTKSPLSFTQYADSALHALTDYVRRHQLVGSLAVQRLLASYGVALDNKVMRRSLYIGHASYPIQFGEVLSHSDTAGAALGDFSGQGQSNGHSDFVFETDEFGMFIVLQSIIPEVNYVQGAERTNMQLTKSDFYTGEFDGTLGTQAINTAELVVALKDDNFNSNVGSGVFGYSGMYYQYKTIKDKMIGDFRLDSINANLLGFSMMREIDTSTYADGHALKHSFSFISPAADYLQFGQRIFMSNSRMGDGFIMVHRFDADLVQTAKPLFETYDFEDDDSSKSVNMDVHGVRVS